MHGCTHTDYPLLIPAAISRIWGYIGSDTLHAPMIVAFLFTFSTVGLIVSAMILIKNRNHGYVTGLILLSLTFFTIHGAGQVADVPFGFFVLSTMVLFFLKDKLPEKSAVFCFLAGMMAGLSAWTKNEGLLFIIIILFSHFIVTVFKQGRASYFKEIRPLFLGLSPVILIIAHFKMNLDISNDLVSKRSAESLVKLLFDPERYLIVGKSYLYYLNKKFLAIIITFPLMLIALKLSGDKNIKVSSTISALAILLLLFGYFMIYIITPHDLAWHVKTSLSRLYLQVMPSVVFVFFMLLNSIGRQPDYGSRK
ncbi:MAG: glycosyltransferase family 39 protein [Proteobacteria bacterium]|nr:glycosyltransferase family 39 protein [Pseudomonadota bacterium]